MTDRAAGADKPDAADAGDAAIEHLSFVSGYLYRLARYEARDIGIRWTALMVLKDLSLLGPSTQRTLADIEQVREPTMTVLLKQMQERGWITRRRDPRNPRTKLVEITFEGQRELRSAGNVIRRRLQKELRGLSTRDYARIESGLRPLTRLLMKKLDEAKTELGA